MMEEMRLQRYLARAGIASRRKAEELITAGRVRVNGVVATLGQSVVAGRDVIDVDGAGVKKAAAQQWLVLNKPAGVLTSAADARGRRTVFDLLPARIPGLTYVGRLDYLTEGVLLLTTDGDAVHKLTHPSSEVERVYQAVVTGDGRAAAAAMRRGVELDIGIVAPRDVVATNLSRGKWLLEITLTEGKNREVRKLCDASGVEVERLVRTRFGPVALGSLEGGATRALKTGEKRAIEELVRARSR
jgi:23S rRNA pseudouridine2605 synthase